MTIGSTRLIAENRELRILAGEEVKAPEELAGYVLHDPLGQKIGKVEAVFLNGTGEPEYVGVRIGVLFFDRRSILLPVESVAVDEGRRILILQ